MSDPKLAMFDKDDVVTSKLLRPKDAATLILVRRDGDTSRILMGRRHGALAFMANKYVFPGGRVDACDLRLTLGGELRAEVSAQLGGGRSKARALGLAAIRETFEETGVLLGRRGSPTARTKAKAWQRFLAHGVVPDLTQLTFIGRAITPPKRPRRFDARFFMADAAAIARTLDGAQQEELQMPCWVTIGEARALDLPSITRRMLDEVEAHLSGDTRRPLPFFRFRHGRPEVGYL